MDARRKWILRRLGPDGSRIELSDLAMRTHQDDLLFAMGCEIGNVHCGAENSRRMKIDAKLRSLLEDSVQQMAALVSEDYRRWRLG